MFRADPFFSRKPDPDPQLWKKEDLFQNEWVDMIFLTDRKTKMKQRDRHRKKGSKKSQTTLKYA